MTPAHARIEPGLPEASPPEGRSVKRHLELVPAPTRSALDEERRVREARWVALLLVVATAAFFGVWTAAVLGAADAAWWPALVGGVCTLVVALGALVIRRAR